MVKAESNRRILLFARVPESGKVKTRLAERLGDKAALRLYMYFVEDILARIQAARFAVTVCYHPAEKGPAMTGWLRNAVHFQPQQGSGLGERMKNAFLAAFSEGAEQAVLMGTDFPDLDIGIIDDAFNALKKKDVAIGPAADGGYYLIGFKAASFNVKIFHGVTWGTKRVFKKTLKLIRNVGLREHVLPAWQDIDTYEDLLAFYKRGKENEPSNLKTMQYLTRLIQNHRL